MGLLKSIEVNNSGVMATYWRTLITEVSDGSAILTVLGYLDKATRDIGKNPIDAKTYSMQAGKKLQDYTHLDTLKLNQKQYGYELIKQTPEFAGSVDG